ncbi:MAG: SDR family NAD(P)-dependent oxidoreductase, partial [Treponema sp.]|nr:SDR family NAD(P)-dependent oxidoreductase [Candidatus Treponema equifaecale]
MNRITIITGASSGMGAEFARQIFGELKENDELWLIARSYEKMEALKNEIQGKYAENRAEIKIFSMDISGREGVERFNDLILREKAAREFVIDTLINNAGFGTYGPFEETPLDREVQMIDLNCTSLTGICGICIPFLMGGSRIINVASLAAFLPLGNFAVYGATKAYVLSFTVALAAELKDKGIKVTALCPGSVSTDFANVASNGARKEVLHGKDPVKVVSHC